MMTTPSSHNNDDEDDGDEDDIMIPHVNHVGDGDEDDNADARKYNDDVDFQVDWGSRGVIGKITTWARQFVKLIVLLLLQISSTI